MDAFHQHRLATRDIARCRELGLVIDEAFERSRPPLPTRRHSGALAVIALALAVVVMGVTRMDRAPAQTVRPSQHTDQPRAGRRHQPHRHPQLSKRVNV